MDNNQFVDFVTKLVMEEISKNENNQSENSVCQAMRKSVPIGVSARHLHLCRAHIEILFGKGHELKKKKELMGGQFAAEECVTIVGTKLRAIENVRILGPERKVSQVEISLTDAIKLGINAPVRDSGSLYGSSAISIVGPKGVVYLEEGCIVAKRHIHMSPSDAEKFSLKDGDMVRVGFDGGRGGVFEDVLIRVDSSYTLEMHIDTDEANGLGLKTGDIGAIL